VLDESGGALPGVTVVVTHQGSGQFRQVVSNADGSYFLTNLIPGPYKVTADLTGFKKYERPGLVIQIGNTATLDITLAVGGLEESVTVSGTSPLVDVTSKQIGANIAEAEIAAAQLMLARDEGLYVEASSALPIAALRPALQSGILDRNAPVVCILTGSGSRWGLMAAP